VIHCSFDGCLEELNASAEKYAALQDVASSGAGFCVCQVLMMYCRLDSVQKASDLEDARAQLDEKMKEIIYEQKQRESLKERYEREIKLMTTAWCVCV
jgi:hypothetical protein